MTGSDPDLRSRSRGHLEALVARKQNVGWSSLKRPVVNSEPKFESAERDVTTTSTTTHCASLQHCRRGKTVVPTELVEPVWMPWNYPGLSQNAKPDGHKQPAAIHLRASARALSLRASRPFALASMAQPRDRPRARSECVASLGFVRLRRLRWHNRAVHAHDPDLARRAVYFGFAGDGMAASRAKRSAICRSTP